MPRQLSTPAPPQCIPVLEGLGLSLWLWNKRTAGTLRFPMDTPQQGSASGFPIFFHNARCRLNIPVSTHCVSGAGSQLCSATGQSDPAPCSSCASNLSCIHFTWLGSGSIAKHKSKTNTWHSSLWSYQSFISSEMRATEDLWPHSEVLEPMIEGMFGSSGKWFPFQ